MAGKESMKKLDGSLDPVFALRPECKETAAFLGNLKVSFVSKVLG